MENYYGMLKKLLLVVAFAVLANLSFAQQVSISGKVVDSGDGNPIPGVSVVVKGTNTATITDFEGRFTIQASTTDVLLISFMGYNTQQVVVGETNSFAIALVPSELGLDEVVVIGYGTQKKREMVGSIATVGSKNINSIAAPSFESALQGQAAGLQVITGSGMAGSGSVIRVRGISSVSANGDPLYVVDGIPITSDIFIANRGGGMNGNPLNTINPNDIESIQVLKDAAAVGIYGSRGANGVIIIETKKGKSGKPVFTFNSRVGISTYTKKPAMMSAEEWLTMRQEAWENDGNTGVPT
jgi:TonB-dependent SusC/RagA subfamily outer membrane receptor